MGAQSPGPTGLNYSSANYSLLSWPVPSQASVSLSVKRSQQQHLLFRLLTTVTGGEQYKISTVLRI